jgi:hypothetical protein
MRRFSLALTLASCTAIAQSLPNLYHNEAHGDPRYHRTRMEAPAERA